MYALWWQLELCVYDGRSRECTEYRVQAQYTGYVAVNAKDWSISRIGKSRIIGVKGGYKNFFRGFFHSPAYTMA